MATSLKSRSFQKNLLMSIGGIFLLFAVCFIMYQHKREKDYKIEILHTRLQMYNRELMQTLGTEGVTDSALFTGYLRQHPIEGLRVSIISKEGRVLMDSHEANPTAMGNHLKRKEIQQTLCDGNGFDIKRTSQSTHQTYFYSASLFGGYIVRTAVPYSAELTRSLEADNTYIIFTAVLTLLLGCALYYSTRRISRHIGYLREFAVKAEEGSEIDHELERRLPDDELGDISHTIIQLYWKLRHSEEDKQRIKRQLTQNAAHELKTPAASIHGYLESILDNPDMPEETRQHFLERCYAQSERMNKLLSDMNMLTKLDSMPLQSEGRERATVDVVAIINSVLDDTALSLSKHGIQVKLNMPQQVLVASPLGASEGTSAIYGIFRNLVDNAVAYATSATFISITYAEDQFCFSDNGCGVEPQHLPHLFERFYRVDKGRSRKMGGTGLGLAIVKNAVAVHGGTVAAEATPGGGLTIRFTLKSLCQ